MRRARAAWLLAGAVAVLAAPAFGRAGRRQAPAAQDDGVPPAEESVHIVKPGETLGGIAHRAHVPRVLIEEANHLKPPYAVHNGQHLFLPRTRHHTVREGETAFDIAMHYGLPFSAIAVASGIKPDAPLEAGQKLLIPTLIPPAQDILPGDRLAENGASAGTGQDTEKSASDAETGKASEGKVPDFSWPLAGKLVRGFTPRGESNHHDGLDIIAPAGTAVRASAGGEVIFAGEEPQSFGKLVVIDHRGGWQSAYGFLARLTVAKGDSVKAHERIGLVGHTGKAPRDELHFEIRKADKPVDPVDVLPDRADAPAKPAAHRPRHRKASTG